MKCNNKAEINTDQTVITHVQSRDNNVGFAADKNHTGTCKSTCLNC